MLLVPVAPRPLSKLESLPAEVLAMIHMEAVNPDFPSASPHLCTTLTHFPPSSVADFFKKHYGRYTYNYKVLTAVIKHPIVTLPIAKQILGSGWRDGRVTLPARLIPRHAMIAGNDRKLLLWIVNDWKLATRHRTLLDAAVLHDDVHLAALLFSVGARIKRAHVLLAIQRNCVKMVKILCQNPLHPQRVRRQHRGVLLCPRLMFAALANEEVAAYFSAVLFREIRDRRLLHRARFNFRGICISGHMIGIKGQAPKPKKSAKGEGDEEN
ncbi:uncharacterized protein LOC62_03G003836 [Vanrija pseudolonga]|uniref:Uncharacterized protein n=1 Tax=Vanrija pseudolonga TaxID=143232 RepID=A0AAF0Y587_9TREE|nr:hypothetical protein LOC62_03G003836 [Vanrija pseudolonga]